MQSEVEQRTSLVSKSLPVKRYFHPIYCITDECDLHYALLGV